MRPKAEEDVQALGEWEALHGEDENQCPPGVISGRLLETRFGVRRIFRSDAGPLSAAKEVAQNGMHLHYLFPAYGLIELDQDAYG